MKPAFEDVTVVPCYSSDQIVGSQLIEGASPDHDDTHAARSRARRSPHDSEVHGAFRRGARRQRVRGRPAYWLAADAESRGDKTLIHNYGHGGGGMSLSCGSADLAAKLALATLHSRAAVIGSGALGLSTARVLQDRGADVTICTRDLPPNTTSNIAGAQWTPTSVADNDRRTPAWDEPNPAQRARILDGHRAFFEAMR